ncbi:MAG: hypothetical protein A2Y76_10540 [Planctomycetes bacterium RBG_13_60_9]|nr:MAG: hypothetical protein A2Y76_10540 [Planctomycetes bacterium RBG_13_60_9]
MIERLCETCEHFSPAHACMEKPTWGHCMKQVKGKPGSTSGKPVPLFTWADNHCDDFQSRQRSLLPGSPQQQA